MQDHLAEAAHCYLLYGLPSSDGDQGHKARVVDHPLAQQAKDLVINAINTLSGHRNPTGGISESPSSSSSFHPFSSPPCFSFHLRGIASPSLPLWMLRQPSLSLCCQQMVSRWLSSLTYPQNPKPIVHPAPMPCTQSSTPPLPNVANQAGLGAAPNCILLPLPHRQSPASAFAGLLCADSTSAVLQSVITAVEESWKLGTSGNWDCCASVLRGVSCLLDSCSGAATRLEGCGLSKQVS